MPTSKIKWFNLFKFPGHRRSFGLIFICLIMASWLGAMTPQEIAELADHYEDKELFFKHLWILAALFVGVYFNRLIYQLTINTFVKKLMQYARELCFSNWLHTYETLDTDSSKKDRYPQGEVLARVMNDTESLRELMTSGAFGIFIDIVFVVSCLVSFLSLNSIAGGFLAIVQIVATIGLIWVSKYMRKIFLEVRNSRAKMSRLLANVIQGLKDTYYTPHYSYASKKGEKVFDEFLEKILKANVWDAGYYSTAESLYPILLALVVVIFPYSEIVQAAVIFAIVDLIQRSIGPIKGISGKIANIQRAYTGIIRIQEFVSDLQSEKVRTHLNAPAAQLPLEKFDVEVDFFQYPNSNTKEGEKPFSLEQIKLSGMSGELIGIVGLSGCGKSTLLNIMAMNILLEQGKMLFTSKTGETLEYPNPLLEKALKFRAQIGIVSQDSHVFSDTLGQNIGLGLKSESDLVSFWEMGLHHIPYLKEWGYDLKTQIVPKEFSSGQKQLVAALRSCFLQRPIVLFDEISSGMDGELEEALRQMVLMIQKQSLTFIVAHRLETIINADQILVMEQGRVVSQGKHSALLDQSAVYREFLEELSLA